MFQYVLFDLDGTLIDSFDGITRSVRHALAYFGIKVSDREELKCFIGPPLLESFMKYYGLSREKAEVAVSVYRERYFETGWREASVISGAEALLSALSSGGKTVALATSKPEDISKRIIDFFNLTRYFDFIGGSELSGPRHNKIDVINYVLENLGNPDKSKTVIIGDRHHDIDGAKEAGISSIGFTGGFGGREELKHAGADYIIQNLGEAEKIIL